MSTTYKTTCPHCSASFKITSEQLSLRDGRARCGNCSSVFQASDFLSPLTAGAHANPTQPAASEHNPATNDLFPEALENSTPQTGNSDDGLDDQFNDLFNDDLLKRGVEETQEIIIPEDALIDDNIDIPDTKDGMKADDLGEDLGIGTLGDELSAEFNNTHGDFSAITDNQVEEESSTPLTEDQWLESLLSEDDSHNATHHDSHNDGNNEQPEDLIGFLKDIGANTAQFSAVKSHQLTQNMSSVNANTLSQDAADSDLGQQSKARTVKQPKKHYFKNISYFLLWGILSLLLLATLASQYLYFNFDALSRNKTERPRLEKICGIVGCELPLMDSSKVGIAESRHFQDSGNPNWTRIKFVLTNAADEPMLLPNLKISFSKKGEITAENIIKPSDYLSSSYKRLPRSQPIDGEILVKTSNNSFDEYTISALY